MFTQKEMYLINIPLYKLVNTNNTCIAMAMTMTFRQKPLRVNYLFNITLSLNQSSVRSDSYFNTACLTLMINMQMGSNIKAFAYTAS